VSDRGKILYQLQELKNWLSGRAEIDAASLMDDVTGEISSLLAQNAKMLAVLKGFEWSQQEEDETGRHTSCPECGGFNPRDYGGNVKYFRISHRPDCALAAAIASASQQEKKP
jgi:hypothetical protein